MYFVITLVAFFLASCRGEQVYPEVNVIVEISNLTLEELSTLNNTLFYQALEDASQWTNYDPEFQQDVAISLEQNEWLTVDYTVTIMESDLVSTFESIITSNSFQTQYTIALEQQLQSYQVNNSNSIQVQSIQFLTQSIDVATRNRNIGIIIGIVAGISMVSIIVIELYNRTETYQKHKKEIEEVFRKCNSELNRKPIKNSNENNPKDAQV